MLLFDNAKLAEGLCRLNHWERYSLPLNALERAVRHRQLDTIAFFLHSGGGILNNQWTSIDSGSNGRSDCSQPGWWC